MTRGGGRRPSARVVGAGVIGLTTALALAEDGWAVEVVADRAPLDTVSNVAAAFWYPYLVGPPDAVRRWGRVARQRFDALADDDGAPVVRRRVHERFRGGDPVEPGWRLELPGAAREEVPAPFTDGWTYTTWVVDMPRYLPWLVARLGRRDVAVRDQRLADLSEAAPGVDLVVDCAGVGARRLVPDPTVDGVGGQVVVVDAPAVTEVWLDADDPDGPTYVVPRTDTVVLGGTSDPATPPGAEPDPSVAAAILDRAVRLVPALAGAAVLGHGLGRRPVRPDVRLELERRDWGTVLHHYGHGGAGVTLSWGSAAAAVALARRTGR